MTTKIKSNSQPVVDYRFVNHYIAVLKILYHGSKNKNKIYNRIKEDKATRFPYQTDKYHVLQSIKDLSGSDLIKENKIKPKKKNKVKKKKANIKREEKVNEEI
jgi:hypothetical protein